MCIQSVKYQAGKFVFDLQAVISWSVVKSVYQNRLQIYALYQRELANLLLSRSVIDIKMRLLVTVELGTKSMPNLDPVSNFIPEYKFLG